MKIKIPFLNNDKKNEAKTRPESRIGTVNEPRGEVKILPRPKINLEPERDIKDPYETKPIGSEREG